MVLYERYKGCFGEPFKLTPRHLALGKRLMKKVSRPSSFTKLAFPQAKTFSSHMGAILSTQLRFSFQSPLGVKSLGLVAILVKQFIRKQPPKPNLLEWAIIRLVVGSFMDSSAVEGFKPMKSTFGFESSHFLHNTKRSFRFELNIAPEFSEKTNLRI